jgi:hypothetical protein
MLFAVIILKHWIQPIIYRLIKYPLQISLSQRLDLALQTSVLAIWVLF